MNDLMIDKRLFIQSKRKNNHRPLLPELKYPINVNINGSNVIRKINEEIAIQTKESSVNK